VRCDQLSRRTSSAPVPRRRRKRCKLTWAHVTRRGTCTGSRPPPVSALRSSLSINADTTGPRSTVRPTFVLLAARSSSADASAFACQQRSSRVRTDCCFARRAQLVADRVGVARLPQGSSTANGVRLGGAAPLSKAVSGFRLRRLLDRCAATGPAASAIAVASRARRPARAVRPCASHARAPP
jgi:hypothetical protein